MKLTFGLIIALCFGIAVNSGTAQQLTLDEVFPTDRVLDVQITLADEDWDTIRHQSRNFFEALNESRKVAPIDGPYTYVDGSVTIDGVTFPNVGIRKKGFLGSQSTTRPSLKIKLNHTDKNAGIEGLTNLTLNNNQQDSSLVSQFMGYALFNAAGSPASRCAYAKVTVNGVNLGIYSHVETVRRSMLRRAFGNDNGTLYEGPYVDFYEGWLGSFEKKNGQRQEGAEED
jgi:spore coat protein CotH